LTLSQKCVKFDNVWKGPNPVVVEPIVFGPFKFETPSARVLRDGVELELRPQACQALKTLLLHSGQFVDYSQMIHEAWGGMQVSKHTVAVTVGEVKKALHEYGAWISYRPRVGYRLEIPRSDDLVKRGWHFWQHHTRDGFDKALRCFEQAAAKDPSDFRAYEGVASTHMMLATYAMRPPRLMYGRYLEAHKRAVELGGWTAELLADRAHGLHVFERNLEQAECQLLQAMEQKPGLSAVIVRLAFLYASSGRAKEALDLLDRWQTDSLCPLLAGAEVLVRIWNRDFQAAVEFGSRAMELHPYHQLTRFYYALARQFSGQLEEALEECRRVALLAPDMFWARAVEGECLFKLGREQEAEAKLESLLRSREIDYQDAYNFAALYTAMGRKEDAFRELERAYEENSCMLHVLDVDPKLDPLRGDPRFISLRERVFCPSLRQAAQAS
jgi:tetratricopeptide (TPR) repeat protein